MIHEGRIVADDDPENLSDRLQSAERIEVSLRGTHPGEAIAAIRELRHVVDVRRDNRPVQERMAEQGVVVLVVDARPEEGATEDVARTIVDSGWGLVNLHPLPMTLEEIFLQLTTEEEASA